jgi:hypothetical protein
VAEDSPPPSSSHSGFSRCCLTEKQHHVLKAHEKTHKDTGQLFVTVGSMNRLNT